MQWYADAWVLVPVPLPLLCIAASSFAGCPGAQADLGVPCSAAQWRGPRPFQHSPFPSRRGMPQIDQGIWLGWRDSRFRFSITITPTLPSPAPYQTCSALNLIQHSGHDSHAKPGAVHARIGWAQQQRRDDSDSDSSPATTVNPTQVCSVGEKGG
jgi:hypothetical protein